MSVPSAVRVTLKWVQITDNLELSRDKQGEFVFTARVAAGGNETVTRLPGEGAWFIS